MDLKKKFGMSLAFLGTLGVFYAFFLFIDASSSFQKNSLPETFALAGFLFFITGIELTKPKKK